MTEKILLPDAAGWITHVNGECLDEPIHFKKGDDINLKVLEHSPYLRILYFSWIEVNDYGNPDESRRSS